MLQHSSRLKAKTSAGVLRVASSPFARSTELDRVAHRGAQQQQADVLREHVEREFPDDAALRVGEAVELVHHHGGHGGEIEPVLVQESVEQDLRDDHEHLRLGVDLAVAGDQSDGVSGEAPALRGGLHLVEFLLGQRDQRGRVVGDAARVEGLEEGRLRDQRFARAGRRADHHALVGGEPSQQRLLLHRIGRVGQLLEVPGRQFVAGHGVKIRTGNRRFALRFKRSASAAPSETERSRKR